MRGRFELVDGNNPNDRGMRFSTLERAMRAWARAVPRDRFYVYDRETKTYPK